MSAAAAASSSTAALPTASGGRKITKAIISQGRKILDFELPTGAEMHEEYDVITDELLLRKFRPKSQVGSHGAWEIEVGTPEGGAFVPDRDLLKETSSSPVVTRSDKPDRIQFRIRNLDYPSDVFAVSIDGATDPHSIVVRTSNKKYFKKLQIPELVRANVPLEGASLSFEHERATLIISYKKPLFLLAVENEDKKVRSSLRFRRVDDPKADPGCAQQ